MLVSKFGIVARKWVVIGLDIVSSPVLSLRSIAARAILVRESLSSVVFPFLIYSMVCLRYGGE